MFFSSNESPLSLEEGSNYSGDTLGIAMVCLVRFLNTKRMIYPLWCCFTPLIAWLVSYALAHALPSSWSYGRYSSAIQVCWSIFPLAVH